MYIKVLTYLLTCLDHATTLTHASQRVSVSDKRSIILTSKHQRNLQTCNLIRV